MPVKEKSLNSGFVSAAKQTGTSSETLRQNHCMKDIPPLMRNSIMDITAVSERRRVSIMTSTSVCVLCKRPRWLTGVYVTTFRRSGITLPPSKPPAVTDASVKVAATVARTEHPHPTQPDTQRARRGK